MKRKRAAGFFLFTVFFCLVLFRAGALESAESGEEIKRDTNIPLTLVFHELGWNALHSLAYNYGLNFAGAGLGTWGMIAGGIDWKWRNLAYDNEWLPWAGVPLLAAGYVIPVLAPVSVYAAGRLLSDTKLQITAAALTQALLLAQTVHLSLKMITERPVPNVISGVFFEPGHTREPREDDFSNVFHWFTFSFYDGWPSGHVLSAFSAAAVIAEIYDDKPALRIGVYAYALLMCVSVAANVHWASDSLAGALMGYAIGKTVGKSFGRLLGKEEKNGVNLIPLVTANTVGIIVRF